VGYLRARDLPVDEDDAVTVVPIHMMTRHADGARLERDIRGWQSEHPGVAADVAFE
jgi:hypothetical protein